MPPRVRRPTDRRGARSEGITDWHLRHRETLRSSRDTYLPREQALLLHQRLTAVLLGAPRTAVISHATAARLWGLEVPLVPDEPRVHLTVPPGTRIRNRADRRVHVSRLPEHYVQCRAGVPVTSPGRTWLDLAASVPAPALLAVADQMLARRYPAVALQRIVVAAAGVRGVAAARRVVPLADGRAGSPMESVLRWLIHEAGLPAPVLQHRVLAEGGGLVGEVDLAWPEAKVLVEFDGNVHRDRRVFVDDLRRQNGLVLAGWTILRFSSADVLGRPRWVIAVVRAALARSDSAPLGAR